MKYSIFLFSLCLVGLLPSCSRQQEGNEFSFKMKEKLRINNFVPEYLSTTPIITLPSRVYLNFKSENFLVEGAVDSNSLKQGYWKITDLPNGLKYQGSYIDNKKSGWWEVFSGNNLECCGNYKLDMKQGFWRYLQIYNGTSKFVNYLNDTLNGLAKEYTSDSLLICEGEFYKGLRNGYWKFYYKNGTIKDQGYYHDNFKSGWWQSYDSLGKPVEEASYSQDEISGYIKRYKDGILAEEGKQFNGRRRGAWKFYDLKGKQNRIQEYDE